MSPTTPRSYQPTLAARTILQISCHLQWRFEVSWAAHKRTYNRWSQPKKNASPIYRPPNGTIIIPNSVKRLQPLDLVNHIQPTPANQIRNEPFCVILTTPSYASSLSQESDFVQNAIRRIYGKIGEKQSNTAVEIQTLCAIVDKLPATSPIQTNKLLEDNLIYRVKSPPVGDAGYEGIAYLTLPAEASLLSELPLSADEGVIDFIFHENVPKDKVSETIVRISLANTVFHTGTPFVMTLSKWKLDAVSGDVQLISQDKVSHHTIRLYPQKTPSGQNVSALSVPLLPLTLPRKVDGSMGNIVRRLIGADGESITASTELETIVPQYFQARNKSAQATTVWALVIPKKYEPDANYRTRRILSKQLSPSERAERKNLQTQLWERMWKAKSPSWNCIVYRGLANGAHLHRVLSGGGGWGKKAGLLSLDPIPVVDTIDTPSQEGRNSPDDEPYSFSSTLTPVVQDGDFIQFFIAPTDSTSSLNTSANFIRLESIPKHRSFGIELGCIPSTMDMMPGGSWQETSTEEPSVAVFPCSFGALSEKGLVLMRRVLGGVAAKSVFRSVVDVPYSRLWVAKAVKQKEKDEKENGKEEGNEEGKEKGNEKGHQEGKDNSGGLDPPPPSPVEKRTVDIDVDESKPDNTWFRQA